MTGVSATPGNSTATVSWTAPSGGPATTYTVTPYIGSTAQPPTTVTGSPAPTSALITGLTNGTAYTFVVTASNPNGSGPASTPSSAVTPLASIAGFVQQVSAHVSNGTSATVSPAANVTSGDRLVVEVGVWGSPAATAKSVTDSAGNQYVELLHFTGADSTEMSVWTAPVTAGGGTKPTITVTPSAKADVGAAALEYSGLSSVSDATVVDQVAHATGTTSGAASVASGATPATTAGNELALGFYADSGFGDTLTAGSGWKQRVNVAPTGDVEFAAEDQVVGAGATPNATVGTGANTLWLMATVVLEPAATAPTAPAAPSGVTATAGNASATVSWTAPYNGGSPLTSYTVTPYIGSTAQTPTTVTGSPPATSATVTGLSNGTAYTFTVKATNVIGTGLESTPSAPVTPTAPTLPAAPTGVTAAPFNGGATVSWTAPSNGGSPISSYTITPYIGSAAQTPTIVSGSPPATSANVTGLTNGTAYTFTVTATNGVGTGPASSASAPVTPTGPTAPGAPSGVTATAGNASATVSWTAPSNGGSLITSYTITPYVGSTAQAPTTVTGSPPVTSATVNGLTNGTAYTFTVTATNGVGTGPASSASAPVTPSAPTVPAAPTGVTATAGNASATVSWTAPSNGGSAITSYTVTPYIGSTAQTPTTVTGSPPATSATVNGLTNGTAYTFTVTATNSVGAGAPSAASNSITPSPAATPPAFVQQAATHVTNATTATVSPAAAVASGDRLVVEVGVWGSPAATAKSVTDSAGNQYVELLHFTGADSTEMSVWTAPVTAGGGTKPTITVTPSAKADVGAAALEYSGLSSVSDATVVDQVAHATGSTSGAASVASGATPATTAGNELALGFYADSGFGDTLTAGSGWKQRVNVAPTGDVEFAAEDQVVGAGATTNATVGTGANTIWLMATVVLKSGATSPPTAPAAPTGVTATAGNASATVDGSVQRR